MSARIYDNSRNYIGTVKVDSNKYFETIKAYEQAGIKFAIYGKSGKMINSNIK